MLRRIALAVFVLALVLSGTFGLGTNQAFAAPPGDNIVEVAIGLNASGPFAGQFSTLIAALEAADPAVIATLSGNGQFTVFAPTNQAFIDLGGYDESNIGDLDQGALTQILLYHVARGRRDSSDVLESSRIRTLQGGFLFQSNGALIDALGREAGFVATDVSASNGIIHAIDAVVLPFAP
jgi:uncharacterized surface protein with fasciclin (FAS1) repeats